MKTILKSFAGIAFAATLAFGMIGCSNGIDTHEHTFATTYTSNETHHWYDATCEHTTEVKDKTEHSFGEWTIKVQPTETAEGKKERECSVCHYKAEEIVAKLEIVKTPAFSVESGAVDSGTSVTISCSTEGAKIYYTKDGSAPTASSTEYTAAISITEAVTIKAIAVKNGMNDSAVASASYTIKGTVATPAFSVAAGEVTSGTIVTITCATEGSKIYYTTDGSAPTASSTEYTAAISITEAVTIKAIAVKDGMNDSAVASTSYTAVGYNLYESPIDAVTGNAATASSTYIYFGAFPKTVLPEGSTVTVDEADSVTMGANTYYKGSDNNYYAKVKENCYGSSGYTYTDTTTVKQSDANSYRYFKVEPIKWKVITTNYKGKALLLAEDFLTANVPYYVSTSNRTIGESTVYANNYKYSTIRAYLNGAYESDDTQDKTAYNGKGFLQTAFTATAQSKIAEIEVDNRKETTGYSESTYTATYACENTTDKIFLLSESEVINSDYGFVAYNSYGQKNARIRVTTDYAKANYANQSTTDGYGGCWWLRSPFCDYYYIARGVDDAGFADSGSHVDNNLGGVVPALCISLQ